jgi:hypothetical protein
MHLIVSPKPLYFALRIHLMARSLWAVKSSAQIFTHLEINPAVWRRRAVTPSSATIPQCQPIRLGFCARLIRPFPSPFF